MPVAMISSRSSRAASEVTIRRDLSDLEGRALTAAALADATERIMTAITGLVAEIRGEEPPTERFRWRPGHQQEEQQ